ncbi:MAG TPA: hypothetical protein VEJ63_07900 [Planctomycetota bacterium]|nr:hypothetical protein [Planctomycetota bacterium]
MLLVRLFCLIQIVALSVYAEIVYPENAAECVRWAGGDLQTVLTERGIEDAEISIRVDAELGAEAFEIITNGLVLEVRGGDANGCMYGLMEIAERVAVTGLKKWPEFVRSLPAIKQKPYIEFRADNPFCHTRPLLFNDVAMWRRYIDMLARCRFNTLDIHGAYDLDETEFPNLLPMLVHVPEYPSVGKPEEQARNLEDFRQIVQHAQRRGIAVALMNYDAEVSGLGKTHWEDYTAKAVSLLLRQVPELKMLGFRVGESGKNAGFHRSAYLKGVELSGRSDVRVYTRSWKANPETLSEIGRQLPGRYDIQIKYNGEQLGLPYHAMHGTHYGRPYASYSYQEYLRSDAPYRVIWQVRANGTHRYFAWADTEFIRRTVRTLRFGNARGFSLEPHIAYFSTNPKNYYGDAKDQSAHDYIWEKHWMWYLAWGRLSYNPDLPETVLRQHFVAELGDVGSTIYDAMQASGPIVPLIMAYRCQGPDHRHFSPETETGCEKEEDPEHCFMHHEPMDTRNFASISEFVDGVRNGRSDGRVGPREIMGMLREAAAKTRKLITQVDALAEGPRKAAHWRLLKTDLVAAAQLGEYYAARIEGALHCCYALKTGSAADYERAVALFARSRDAWNELAQTADAVYAPLNNPLRAQRKFRWQKPLKELEAQDRSVFEKLWKECKVDPHARPLSDMLKPHADVTFVKSVRCTVASKTARIVCEAAGEVAVRAWYKPLPSDLKWTSVELTRSNDGTFSGELPLDARGLLYQLEVRRGASATLVPNVLKTRPYWVIEPCAGERASCDRTESFE